MTTRAQTARARFTLRTIGDLKRLTRKWDDDARITIQQIEDDHSSSMLLMVGETPACVLENYEDVQLIEALRESIRQGVQLKKKTRKAPKLKLVRGLKGIVTR